MKRQTPQASNTILHQQPQHYLGQPLPCASLGPSGSGVNAPQASAASMPPSTRPTAVYQNLIPAYYIPAASIHPADPHMATQRGTVGHHSTAGFLVQAQSHGQPTFIQQQVPVSCWLQSFVKLQICTFAGYRI